MRESVGGSGSTKEVRSAADRTASRSSPFTVAGAKRAKTRSRSRSMPGGKSPDARRARTSSSISRSTFDRSSGVSVTPAPAR